MNRRDLLRWSCYFGIAALYVASVPWYRETGHDLVVWLGLPDWAAVALLCYVGVAVLNTVAWFASDLPDDPDPLEAPALHEAQPLDQAQPLNEAQPLDQAQPLNETQPLDSAQPAPSRVDPSRGERA